MVQALGIDVGGTLTKIAYYDNQNQLILEHFPSSDMEEVSNWIASFSEDALIGLTGGRSEQLKPYLKQHKNLHYIVEFDATVAGVNFQIQQQGYTFNEAIVTNIGTGTSIHLLKGNLHERVGGTGIGGGTLLGLSNLMTGIVDFETIVELSSKGSRAKVDILVSDIYFGNKTPIDGGLTASNFGDAGLHTEISRTKEDLIASIQGLVGEVISTLSIQTATSENIEHILYIGSTLSENVPLQTIIGNYTKRKNRTPIFLEDNGFSGAIGALLSRMK